MNPESPIMQRASAVPVLSKKHSAEQGDWVTKHTYERRVTHHADKKKPQRSQYWVKHSAKLGDLGDNVWTLSHWSCREQEASAVLVLSKEHSARLGDLGDRTYERWVTHHADNKKPQRSQYWVKNTTLDWKMVPAHQVDWYYIYDYEHLYYSSLSGNTNNNSKK